MRGSAAFRTGVAPGGALAGPWVRNPLWRNARAVPSLDLQLADNKSLVDGVTGQNLVTFTRASSGTFVGSDGLIQTATTNEPRFDHNPTTGESLGLLVEEARTNLTLRSEEFNDASWTISNATVSANLILGPNDTLTADKLTENTATSDHSARQTVNASATTAYSASFWAKAGERNFVGVWLRGSSSVNRVSAQFNLATGTISTAASAIGLFTSPQATITAFPNGWYRCTITATTGAVETTVALQTFVNSSSGQIQTSYAGDGTSGIYLWGAQLEAGAFPTSYIPTTTATVTRAADVASITGSNFSSWYNQTEGTVFAEALGIYSTGSVLTFSDGSNNNRMLLDHGTNTRRTRFISGGSEQAAFSPSYTYGTQLKTSFSYASNYFSMANAGVLASGAPDTSGLLSVGIDRIFIGSNSTGAGTYSNTSIRRLTYWPTRLADTTLQRITQP
jgi:hypothetical protein